MSLLARAKKIEGWVPESRAAGQLAFQSPESTAGVSETEFRICLP